MKLFTLILLLTVIFSTSFGQKTPAARELTYLDVNFDRANYADISPPIRLRNLKGDIRKLVQIEYGVVKDNTGNITERFIRGAGSFGYLFDKNKRIIEGWSYSDPVLRYEITKYKNFKTGLKENSQLTSGDTILQRGESGSINYYLNENLVKTTFPDLKVRILYQTSGKDQLLEKKTYVNGVFQASEQFDRHRNPVYCIFRQLHQGQVTLVQEMKFEYDADLNKISQTLISKTKTDTSSTVYLSEYENGMLTKEYRIGKNDRELREYYNYNQFGDAIESREHLLDYKHEYTYDHNQNWIEHKIYEVWGMKEPLLLVIRRRVIEYW